MSRHARSYQLSNTQIYHVLNRGILRQTIFHEDEDMAYFINVIKRYRCKVSFEVYHWCIMPNHYHIIAEFLNGHLLSKVIGACQQIYALYYHRKYQTAGRLFQNRFKSQAIEKETYLLACGRYVELNPLRAGLVGQPWDWKWSSAQYYIFDKNDGLTAADPIWKSQAQNEPDSYKKWLLDTKDIDKETELFKGSLSIIGSSEFTKKHIIQNGHAILKKKGRPRKVKWRLTRC
jgi:REP element-mobilizing transposase RayT